MHLIALTAFSLISVAAASSAALARSTVNGACTGSGGAPGVCILDTSCSAAGGTYITNACPDTPDDIKCCTKKSCGNGGECMFASSCKTGSIVSGLCPGPSNFECCEPKSSSTGNLGEKILAKAEQAKGIPYVWSGGSCSGPTKGGFDCSGLVSWAVCAVTGRSLFAEGLRVTYDMYCASASALKPYTKIPYSERRAGDAVFFGGACDCAGGAASSGVHHVGLMMDSGTEMWNALHTGTTVGSDNFAGWSGTDKPCPYVIRFN